MLPSCFVTMVDVKEPRTENKLGIASMAMKALGNNPNFYAKSKGVEDHGNI